MIGKVEVIFFESTLYFVFDRCIDEEAKGHHHEEGFDSFGFLEVEGGDEEVGALEKTKAPLYALLLFVDGEDLFWGELFFI